MPALSTLLSTVTAICVMAAAPPSADQSQQSPAAPSAAALDSPATTALSAAASDGRYALLFFRRADDQATKSLRITMQKITESLGGKATLIEVDSSQAAERPLLVRFALNRSRMPLTLAVAPNGAVTGSFASDVTESAVRAALLSPAAVTALKAMQDRKMVLICIQGASTGHNAEALAGANAFAASEQAAKQVDVVVVDPHDPAELSFLKQMAIDPETSEAVTVFMAPPGKRIASYVGSVDAATIAEAARKAGTACDPASGCCPPKGAAGQGTAKDAGTKR